MLSLLRKEKGAATVMLGLMLVSLLGFAAIVVDIGVLLLNKVQITNNADAAALAGAQDLPLNPVQAFNTAKTYSQLNGKQDDGIQITLGNENKDITVAVTRKVGLFFAKVFSMEALDINASSKALIKPISGGTGMVPFGIVKQNFIFGTTYTLKLGGGSGYNGNFDALGLGGSGSQIYLNNVKYGYKGKLKIGDMVSTETGNMSGPTIEGVNYRISLDADATFNNVAKNSARIVTVPVIDSLEVNGNKDVKIVGFAAFFLEGVGGTGNDNFVYGKFMQMVIPGDITTDDIGYGLYGTTLVQ